MARPLQTRFHFHLQLYYCDDLFIKKEEMCITLPFFFQNYIYINIYDLDNLFSDAYIGKTSFYYSISLENRKYSSCPFLLSSLKRKDLFQW